MSRRFAERIREEKMLINTDEARISKLKENRDRRKLLRAYKFIKQLEKDNQLEQTSRKSHLIASRKSEQNKIDVLLQMSEITITNNIRIANQTLKSFGDYMVNVFTRVLTDL